MFDAIWKLGCSQSLPLFSISMRIPIPVSLWKLGSAQSLPRFSISMRIRIMVSLSNLGFQFERGSTISNQQSECDFRYRYRGWDSNLNVAQLSPTKRVNAISDTGIAPNVRDFEMNVGLSLIHI